MYSVGVLAEECWSIKVCKQTSMIRGVAVIEREEAALDNGWGDIPGAEDIVDLF
jgi:hypothetical protein